MTAEIVIMNREAVVLAADSAITIGEGPKILNTANKVFMLVPGYPVGVLIYNIPSLMGVPWEIIIKEFRDYSLSRNIDYDDLEQFALEFLLFVERNGTRFVSDSQENKTFRNIVFSEFGDILRNIWGEIRDVFYKYAQISENEIKDIVTNIITKFHDDWSNGFEILPDEKAKEFRNLLLAKFGKTLSQIIKTGFENFSLSTDNVNKLVDIGLYSVSKIDQTKTKATQYSGIVFAGYGKMNLFPVCINYEVYSLFCGILAYREEDKTRIGFSEEDVSSAVLPFAQGDVTQHLLSGRIPNYEMALRVKLIDKFDKKEVEDILKEVNELAWINHTQPIIDTIDILPKDELASVAKTLVNLTSFMRHVSSGIETVGGPVDVAVISKKDGFVWIDRKHYFDISKNLHFGYETKGEQNVESDEQEKEK